MTPEILSAQQGCRRPPAAPDTNSNPDPRCYSWVDDIPSAESRGGGATQIESDLDNDDQRVARVRAFVASGGRVVGGTAGAAVGLIGGPVAALAGGAAGAALGDVLANAGVEFCDRVLGHQQAGRAAGALAVAVVEIDRRLAAGDAPRRDFINDDDDSSDAAEVLEGTLLAAANAYEQRKIEYIGTFYANLAFEPHVSPQLANLLLQLLGRLTYGELRLMAVLGDETYRAALGEGRFRSDDEVVAEILELCTMGLAGIGQDDGTVVSPAATYGGGSWQHGDLSSARLTAMGQRMHSLLGLAGMPSDDRAAVTRGLRS